MAAEIAYKINVPVELEQLQELYRASTLAERRPVEDLKRFSRMIAEANLTVTAWDEALLVGISRTLTDFAWVAYLADLAVHREYQRRGIGRELIRHTKAELTAECKIVLLAAPDATSYYPHIGFKAHNSAWILE